MLLLFVAVALAVALAPATARETAAIQRVHIGACVGAMLPVRHF